MFFSSLPSMKNFCKFLRSEFSVIYSSHRTLSSGHTPVFRHSASLINDLMIIIGGNVHNESSSRIQECYSGDIQAYDIGLFVISFIV